MDKQMIPDQLMAEFADFVTDALGLSFPQRKWSELEKTFFLAMQAFKFTEAEQFVKWLKHNPLRKEVIAFLARHLTIGETYFFRDSSTFAALKKHILPDILKRHEKDRKIRIWCVGCCTGEEPYSVAILLHQLLRDFKNWNIFILGSDINLEFLHKAKQARYRAWSFRNTPHQIIEKYFIKSNSYTLIPEIQSSVTFAYLNLVDHVYPNPVNQTNDMDLILCHNVLIYFAKKYIHNILHRLVDALQDQGWLSVSAVEASFVKDERLIAQHFEKVILFKKTRKEELTRAGLLAQPENCLEKLEPKHSFDHQATKKAISEKRSDTIDTEGENFYETCLHLSQQKKYDEAIAKLHAYLNQKEVKFLRQHAKELTLLIHLYANRGNFSDALHWCETAIKLDKLNPILHYLHATILHALGDRQKAAKSLTRALFLNSDFVAAHYLLGLIELEQKNQQAAFRCFKVALELLENYQRDDVLPGTEELTAGRLKDVLLNFLEKS